MKTTLLLPAAVLIGGLVLPLQAQITDELVVHLPFDNNYSNTRANGVTATAVGNPTFAAGKIGSGAVTVTTRKDGSDFSYVTLGNPVELAFGGVTDGTATDFTVAFLVSLTTGPRAITKAGASSLKVAETCVSTPLTTAGVQANRIRAPPRTSGMVHGITSRSYLCAQTRSACTSTAHCGPRVRSLR
jgi:hypothetical protein